MQERQAIFDHVLSHGWDDDDLEDLERALDTGLEEALAIPGEQHCPAVEYCEMVALLLEWRRTRQKSVI